MRDVYRSKSTVGRGSSTELNLLAQTYHSCAERMTKVAWPSGSPRVGGNGTTSKGILPSCAVAIVVSMNMSSALASGRNIALLPLRALVSSAEKYAAPGETSISAWQPVDEGGDFVPGFADYDRLTVLDLVRRKVPGA